MAMTARGSIVPITILHHNDSHGNLAKGTYVGYTQLATLIKQERAYNPEPHPAAQLAATTSRATR